MRKNPQARRGARFQNALLRATNIRNGNKTGTMEHIHIRQNRAMGYSIGRNPTLLRATNNRDKPEGYTFRFARAVRGWALAVTMCEYSLTEIPTPPARPSLPALTTLHTRQPQLPPILEADDVGLDGPRRNRRGASNSQHAGEGIGPIYSI